MSSKRGARSESERPVYSAFFLELAIKSMEVLELLALIVTVNDTKIARQR